LLAGDDFVYPVRRLASDGLAAKDEASTYAWGRAPWDALRRVDG